MLDKKLTMQFLVKNTHTIAEWCRWWSGAGSEAGGRADSDAGCGEPHHRASRTSDEPEGEFMSVEVKEKKKQRTNT